MATGKTTLSWLRVLRENAGHTQAYLAAVLDVTAAFVSQLETGARPLTPGKAATLSRLFGVSVEALAALEAGVTPNEALIEYLRARGVDPNPPPTDEEIDRMTTKQLRAYLRKHDPTRERLPEVWYELRRRDSGGTDAYYEKQDAATYKLLRMRDPDGRVTVEEPPPWFVAAMESARRERAQAAPAAPAVSTSPRPRARPRERRSTTRRSTRAGPSSDDDGEHEPGEARPSQGVTA